MAFGHHEVGVVGVGSAGGEVVVFAASSLSDVFAGLAVEFERIHPGTKVALHCAGSQQLRLQIAEGAPADVFAAADAEPMDALVQAGRVADVTTFATNSLVIVVAHEARARLASFSALPEVARLVVGADAVPIGRYARQMLAAASDKLGADFAARVQSRVVSRELSVRAVLARVALGEADAGIVYRTDVIAAQRAGADIATVEVPSAFQVAAHYPIAVLVGSRRPDLAQAWVALVQSAVGRRALDAAGFVSAAAAAAP